MILSQKRTINALISLRSCAGLSAPVLFANPRIQVYSRRGPNAKPIALDQERYQKNRFFVAVWIQHFNDQMKALKQYSKLVSIGCINSIVIVYCLKRVLNAEQTKPDRICILL